MKSFFYKYPNILYNKSKWKILLKNLALNPLIIASFLGFIVNYSDISPGLIFKKFLDSISDSAFTIGLLCVGSSLKFNINLKDSKIILITSSIKLLIMPILGYIIFLIIGIENLLLSVGILYLALPTASNSYILSKQMGGDPESMATILTFTIIFSIFTISILTVILS
jgi:predicted permease